VAQPHSSYRGTREAIEDEATREQREAIVELGDALRDLVQHASATEAPPADLRQVAALVRAATGPLASHPRGRTQMPSADDLLAGIRLYNPVTGAGSALAPPLHIEVVDGVVVGTCTLGLAFEGPPMYAHGGVSAMLLDHLLGYVVSADGHPGLTVSLVTRYRAPVPLQTPLRLTGHVTGMNARGADALGIIATAAEPEKALVEATASFASLRVDQAIRLFGAALHPDATDPAAAHD
jgi:hypothetical protein